MFFLPPELDFEGIARQCDEYRERKRKQDIVALAKEYSIQLYKDKYKFEDVNQKAFEMAKQFYDFSDSVGEKE